jgi:hypothetical protein
MVMRSEQEDRPNPQDMSMFQGATLSGADIFTLPTDSDPALRQDLNDKWPHLTPAEIDHGWQQAINHGPVMLAQQVAYALAVSLQHAPVSEPATVPDQDATAQPHAQSGLLTLAALAEVMEVRERIALLDEIDALDAPTVRARGLMLLAPHVSGKKQRDVIHDAYKATRDITDPGTRAALLGSLIPLLQDSQYGEIPSGLVAETLDLASRINNVEARLRSLTALAQYVAPTIRIALLLAVLDNIATMSQSDAQAGALIVLAPYLLEEVHHRTLTVAAHISDPAARARALTGLARHLPEQLQPRLRAAALEAVATIANENERAQALAAFAPHLEGVRDDKEEFPILLERALEIAINMHHREARARALVGLHTRLPHNLQGEALAAVNAVGDEHHRAQMLAELAPALSPDIAIAALAVAHDIRQRDARFLALKSLGSRQTGAAAERTWLDALAVAVGLPRQLERVLALAELAPQLPDELRYRTLVNALNTARSIVNERARVRAISTLAPLLVDHQQLLADALADSHTVTNPVEKAGAMIALIPCLPEGDPTQATISESLSLLREISVEYRRARALISMAEYVSGEHLVEAIRIALEITDPYDRATTLIALMQGLDAADRPRILQEALQSARGIMDDYDRASALAALWPLADAQSQADIARSVLAAVRQIGDDYDRASGISVFAPLLAAQEMPSLLPPESQVLREALLSACRVADTHQRAVLLKDLSPAWIELHPPNVGYALWCEVLILLSRRTLPDLLNDLSALSGVLQAIGSKDAQQQVVQVVKAARQWTYPLLQK